MLQQRYRQTGNPVVSIWQSWQSNSFLNVIMEFFDPNIMSIRTREIVKLTTLLLDLTPWWSNSFLNMFIQRHEKCRVEWRKQFHISNRTSYKLSDDPFCQNLEYLMVWHFSNCVHSIPCPWKWRLDIKIWYVNTVLLLFLREHVFRQIWLWPPSGLRKNKS